MSTEYWFRGELVFADAASVAAARAELHDGGYVGHEDNLVSDEALRWNGLTLTIDDRGSMPYAAFEISASVMSTWARHALSGEVLTVSIEDGHGERHRAGGAGDDGEEVDDELDDDEIEALRAEYGWESEDDED